MKVTGSFIKVETYQKDGGGAVWTTFNDNTPGSAGVLKVVSDAPLPVGDDAVNLELGISPKASAKGLMLLVKTCKVIK